MFTKKRHKASHTYTKEYNLYYIGFSLLTLCATFYGAIIFHTYLNSIDALFLFSSTSPTHFILIFISSLLFISLLFIIFSMPYWIFSSFNKQKTIKSNGKIISISEYSKSFIICNILFFYILFSCILYIIIFQQEYNIVNCIRDEKCMIRHSIYWITILITIFISIVALFKNIKLYKYYASLNSHSNKTFLATLGNFISYIANIIQIVIPFFIISFYFVMLFGLNDDHEDLPKVIYYFLIIYIIFFIMPSDKKSLSLKQKCYKIISFSLLCIGCMALSSLFLNTRYTNNMMRLIGLADAKTTPYIISNPHKYDLENQNCTKNIYCGKVLFRNNDYEIFLLETDEHSTEKDKLKKRLLIEKKDIYPLQGNQRLTYCTTKQQQL